MTQRGGSVHRSQESLTGTYTEPTPFLSAAPVSSLSTYALMTPSLDGSRAVPCTMRVSIVSDRVFVL